MSSRRSRTPPDPSAPPLLGAFPPEAVEALRAAAVRRAWIDGSTVLARGELVQWVQVVVRGRLRVTGLSDAGDEVFFRWQGPGEIVGLASAVSGRPLPVEIVAFDGCETLQVARDTLLAVLRADARAAMAAAELLAGYTYDLIELVILRTESTLMQRVLHVLRHLALLNGRQERPGTWTLAITQTELAAAVNASRQRVNAELRALERDGLIELGYRRVRVHGVAARPPGDEVAAAPGD